MPKWLAVLIICAAILFVTQIFFIPMLIISILLLLAPVILIVEKSGVISIILDALFMRYTKKFPIHRWFFFFHVLTLGMAFYLMISMILLAGGYLQNIDSTFNMTRDFFITSFPGFSFGPSYVLTTFIITITLSLLVSFFGIISTCFYLFLKTMMVISITLE
ncbi:MAG: hypothetical protein HQK54_01355 [Oligoflexales bacterium]|nr:hypothetical protein [Oligoflexales bacterium]